MAVATQITLIYGIRFEQKDELLVALKWLDARRSEAELTKLIDVDRTGEQKLSLAKLVTILDGGKKTWFITSSDRLFFIQPAADFGIFDLDVDFPSQRSPYSSEGRVRFQTILQTFLLGSEKLVPKLYMVHLPAQ